MFSVTWRFSKIWLRGSIEVPINFLVIGAGVTFVIWQGAAFAINVATVWVIFAILAISLNLLVGFTGLLSVAPIAFYGIGAYAVAILTTRPTHEAFRIESLPTLGFPFFVALPIGIILVGIVALLVGDVVRRFRDELFFLMTFGFAVIANGIFENWRSLTRGPFGIREIARPAIGGWILRGELEFLVLGLIFLMLIVIISWFIISSSFGRVLMAIREDEMAIQILGYKPDHFKLIIWIISSMMAGLAGGLFAGWTTFVDPRSFTFLESVYLLVIVIVGGLATIRGSLVGALVFVLLGDLIRFVPGLPPEYIGQIRQAIFGILLVVLMLFRPEGMMGRYRL